MGTRTGSHQLSSGLMVSGRPERHLKERQPTMSSRSVIYTGGDVTKSGEFGRMYGVENSGGENPPRIPTRPPGSAAARSGPIPGAFGPKLTNSGPTRKMSSSFSGPATPIQPTGLITSGSIRRSGQLDASSAPAPARRSFKKTNYGSAVTSIREEVKFGFGVSRVAVWVCLALMVMGLAAAAVGILIAAGKIVIILMVAVAVAVLLLVVGIVVWNYAYRKKGVLGFLKRFPDSELRNAVDGQFVKVTGVVTCGSIPLETSYQRVPRCVYVSSELHEYRGCGGNKVNTKHRLFSWGCRDSEAYVAEFYISDNMSGERALVKAGYGAKVSPFVKLAVVVDAVDREDMSPNFVQWLSGRGLSSDDRVLRLKEGYVKEGYTVSIFGMVRRHNNMFTIVPPPKPISTGFQWSCCLFPAHIDGIILVHDENEEVIPV